jgi:hypothetical protein
VELKLSDPPIIKRPWVWDSRCTLFTKNVTAYLGLSDNTSGPDMTRYPHVSPNRRPAANGHTPESCRTGLNYHVVFNYRMAGDAFDWSPVLTDREALGAKSHCLVQANAAAIYLDESTTDTC